MISDLTPIDTVIKHFEGVDPVIAQILPEINWADWFEDRASSDHFYNLTRNIIYQQLAGKAASTIFGRFENLVGSVTPKNVLLLEDQKLRDVGLSWAKVSYVKDLAAKVESKEVSLSHLETLDRSLDRRDVFVIYTPQREHL
jgi:DNA-3-methyladenine glycosylase II